MIYDLGVIDYTECWRIQKEFVRQRRLGERGDTVLIAEHNAVFTIGRSGSKKNLLVSKAFLEEAGIPVIDVDRGGDITFHGPGQLVVYPIVDLKFRNPDLHWYMRELELVGISLLKDYGIRGTRIEGKTGIWVNGEKIASIGVGASNWVSYHGMGMNVAADLNFFSMINPCGMNDIRVTSIRRILCNERQAVIPSMADVKTRIRYHINRIFFGMEKVPYEQYTALA